MAAATTATITRDDGSCLIRDCKPALIKRVMKPNASRADAAKKRRKPRAAYGAFAYLLKEKMVDDLARNLALLGRPSVDLPYDDWAALANVRLFGALTKGDSLRSAFRERASVYELDPIDGVVPTFELFTPGRRGTKIARGRAGLRVTFTRGKRELDVVPADGGGEQPIVAEAASARRIAAGLVAAAAKLGEAGKILESIGLTRIAGGIMGYAERKGVPIRASRALVLAASLGVATIAAGAAAVGWVWTHFLVRPVRVQERTPPVPPEAQRLGRSVGTISISGAKGDWSGKIEVRYRGDASFLFTYVSTVPLPCPDVAGQPPSRFYAWRFNGGAGFSAWESSGSSAQIVHRFPSPPAKFEVELQPTCGATYSADMPALAPSSGASITVTYDAQGQPIFDVVAKVAADQPIPGATVVPVIPTALPAPSPSATQPDPNARSK
jgi:hypothetical protein